ncbi:MAG TPA: type IV secretion protein IcmO [Rhodospirillaceae bacterium]|jgi:intracellular multiplication protein IcmO|nr:TraM recognition domain-containing protein [Alphaproteobacteria bacterium]HBH25901.1 type IV secretion protein IcmO [Rhodospirillaceae bacterium]
MALDSRKYEHKHEKILRDIRPFYQRIGDRFIQDKFSAALFLIAAASLHLEPYMASFAWVTAFGDLLMVFALLYFWWLATRGRELAFKLPMGAIWKDKNNEGPGLSGKAEGILYLGNVKDTKEEVWFTNADARTHVLYLGTTGSGKTVGLTSIAANALAWGSGFVYIDGKADTDLWSSLSALVRRFGRDDDLLVLNYMTGNVDSGSVKPPSNTMNPFASGSASYLVNMLVSLMPEPQGDNAMWQERAVALISAMMPAMTWKRDNQDMPLSVRTIRNSLSLPQVIKLARDPAIPAHIKESLNGYLDTLPGYVEAAYDDEGKPKPPAAGQPAYDTTTAGQQHGYLAMQFTRSLQSLGDDYGYIFDTQAADIDMVDVVLNRRILVVLIPALEKSNQEIANLGKIVAATIKGMMGSTLGATLEGESTAVIENKPTHSSTPFITIFDEVGYYTAEGMAVMAAQARSLGFCLVFSGQDLPAMQKRVKEEANSIVANCNIKIFGKLEDPTETKDFFEKTVGQAYVTEVSNYEQKGIGSSYFDTGQSGVQERARASYSGLRDLKQGESVLTFGKEVMDCKMFYANPGKAKAMRVTRFMSLPEPDKTLTKHAGAITALRDLMVSKSWTAERADVAAPVPMEVKAMLKGLKAGRLAKANPIDAGVAALTSVLALDGPIKLPPAKPPPAPKAQAKPRAEAKPAPPPSAPAPVEQGKRALPQSVEDILTAAAAQVRSTLFGQREAQTEQKTPAGRAEE